MERDWNRVMTPVVLKRITDSNSSFELRITFCSFQSAGKCVDSKVLLVFFPLSILWPVSMASAWLRPLGPVVWVQLCSVHGRSSDTACLVPSLQSKWQRSWLRSSPWLQHQMSGSWSLFWESWPPPPATPAQCQSKSQHGTRPGFTGSSVWRPIHFRGKAWLEGMVYFLWEMHVHGEQQECPGTQGVNSAASVKIDEKAFLLL